MDSPKVHLLVADLPEDDPRPLLLIDVDGVLNALPRHAKPQLYDVHRVTVSNGLAFTVRFRKDLPELLFALTKHFVPVWCTMWDHEANLYLAPLLGLPDLPVVLCHDNARDLAWSDKTRTLHHKVDPILNSVGNRAFAWIDDEITEFDEAWAAKRSDEEAPTMVLKIDERSGLLEHHVDKLIAWAKARQEA